MSSEQHLHFDVTGHLRAQGFAFAPAAVFKTLLPEAALRDWPSFAASWNDLGVDTYMADGGRYRRRRFDAFAVSAKAIQRKPRQPHYQSRDYNTLNGGIERWFQSMTDHIASHPLLMAILRTCYRLFDALTPAAAHPAVWHVECHQFRIEAHAGEQGKPTPEGLHRDGVDWVLVMLVTRENIAEGVTTIHDTQRHLVGSFTLVEAGDAAFVDDSRVWHGVTPVSPIDAGHPAFRDVLVVTFRQE
ncbi:MAG: 2OG-Fe dioxygenase family protein [Steroidobacteraceae bacterium]